MNKSRAKVLGAVLGGFVTCLTGRGFAAQEQKPNVLFIAVDDLNDWIGCLGGHPQARTPNIDRLAARGMLFSSAYCAVPYCAPSRAAIFLGQQSVTSGVYINEDFRTVCPQAVTLTGLFHDNGYHVAGGGKLYHMKVIRHSDWDEYFPSLDTPQPHTKFAVKGKPLCGIPDMPEFMDWGPLDTDDETMDDMQVADWGGKFLQRDHEKPFFLGIGIFHPHLPMYVPQKYYDMFPFDQVQLPPIKDDDLDDVPRLGKLLATRDAWPAAIRNMHKGKEHVQAYLASIAFADACIGKILDALDASPYASNTVVMLWGDNGLHNGEKGNYAKFTLWERSARVPLIISVPGRPKGVCQRPVSLVDMYATLTELCGLPKPDGLDSTSLVPLLNDPGRAWDKPVLTTFAGDRSLRTERYRYIRYSDGSEELYDHRADSNEWVNLALNPEYAEILKKMSADLNELQKNERIR